MKRSSFQKVAISIAFSCVMFVITPSGLAATREKIVGERSLKKYLEDGKKFEKWQKGPFLALYMYSMMQEAKESISSLSAWMPSDFPEVKASKKSVE